MPDEYKLKRKQFKKYIEGINQEKKYNTNDIVRFLKNKRYVFQKNHFQVGLYSS